MLDLSKSFLTAAVILAAAGPAMAEFPVPEGCTAYMTVQSRNCQVTHYYTCAADPAGHQWRADVGLEGAYYLSQIDKETQWVLSIDLVQGIRERLSVGAADPASFSELVETGIDSFDFSVINDQGEETRVVGFDRLTGNEVVIDGVSLLETQNQVTFSDAATGEEKWSAAGNEYISVEHRTFLSGSTTWTEPDGAENSTDDSPIEFAFPGDAGFLADKPKFDCSVVQARFDFDGGAQ